MIKVFLDTDVILDLLFERDPFNKNANTIFKDIENGSFTGYTSPVILANIYYISSNIKNKKTALKNIRKICSLLKLSSVDQKITDNVLANNEIKDFEDYLQLYSAIEIGTDFLITRNKKDFPKNDSIKIIGSDEFVELMEIGKETL
jgi:predicted nucleic acid-binding protein